MNKFQQTTPPIQQPSAPSYADRQFLHTFLAGALLPLVQSTITAVMAGIGTLTALYLFGAIDLLKPSLIITGIVWVLTWLYLQRRWLNLTSFENFMGVDLNGDGNIGKPMKEPEHFVIRLDEITADQHYRSRNIDSVISKEQMTVLARGLLNGIPFSERNWAGAGKPLSSTEFRTLRSVWLKQGLLEVTSDKDNRQGFYLTDQGWSVMEQFANTPPPGFDTSGRTPLYSTNRGGNAEGIEREERELSEDERIAIENENATYDEKFQS